MNAPSPIRKCARAYVESLQAQMDRLTPLPRRLTEAELVGLTEAREAGAVIVPRLLREYLSGKPVCPYQFEGCSYSVWPGDEWAHPLVAQNIAKRDAFLARLVAKAEAA